MSVVKAKLQEKNAEFISIREVLELLSQQGDGCSMDEAAQYLLGRLQEPGSPIAVWKRPEGLFSDLTRPYVSLLISASSADFWRWEADDIPF